MDKLPFESKTIQGVALTLIIAILNHFQIGFDESTLSQIIASVLFLGATAWSVYGRYKANGQIVISKNTSEA